MSALKNVIRRFLSVDRDNFGPSGVRALPLAAGIYVGGHYFGPSVLRAPAEQTKVATIFITKL